MPSPRFSRQPAQQPPEPGSVRPTSVRSLTIAAIVGAVLGWLVGVGPNLVDLPVPQVPWSAAVALVLAAVLVALLARSTHVRIQRRREYVDPARAVGLLVLGKASALAGALVATGYLVFGLLFVDRLAAPYPRERVIRSAVGLIGAAGLCVAGLALERACKVPRPPDEHGRGTGRGEGDSR